MRRSSVWQGDTISQTQTWSRIPDLCHLRQCKSSSTCEYCILVLLIFNRVMNLSIERVLTFFSNNLRCNHVCAAIGHDELDLGNLLELVNCNKFVNESKDNLTAIDLHYDNRWSQ